MGVRRVFRQQCQATRSTNSGGSEGRRQRWPSEEVRYEQHYRVGLIERRTGRLAN